MRRSICPRRATLCTVGLALAFAGLGTAAAQEGTLRASLKEQSDSDKAGARVQAQIDTMADQTAELLGEYRLAIQSYDRVKVYNGHLESLVNDQERVKASMSTQLENFLTVEQEIVPLMTSMISNLEQFIRLDIPFHLENRLGRVEKLNTMMGDSNVTTSEKYRRIMEAYQIEIDLGRKVDAYTGWLETGGSRREVDFFQVGRLLLAYQTSDRSETGFWDVTASPPTWKQLPDSYRNFVTDGLRIARKQAAPNLLKLPVPAPEVVR